MKEPTGRQRHNDYDYECIYWYGDRHPGRNRSWKSNLPWTEPVVWKPVPLTHREMNGTVVTHDLQRCLVCNPYDEEVYDYGYL